MTLRFKDIASRITGISIPVFGVSWTPPESERQIVRETFVFLEDRRALYNDYAHEIEDQVLRSVIEIRKELTEALKRLPEDSEAMSSFRAMRAACREYCDSGQRRHFPSFSFVVDLGRLRAIFGTHVAYLAVKYGIDLTGELVRLVPPDLREAKFLEP